MSDFLDLGIGKDLKDILKKNGIVQPTQIQEQCIRPLLKGRDVVAQAHTGTGKTLAFLLPIMKNIDPSKPHVQGLIITPTRELAIQITAEAKKLAEAKDINILSAYGGQDVERQRKRLKGAIHMVIATPGRLIDHLKRKSIDLGKLKMVVLDEADQMLHMGFLQDVEDIVRNTPKGRQTMFFSATMPEQIRKLASRYMKNPLHIKTENKKVVLDEIEQVVVKTTEKRKLEALCKYIDENNPFMGIIFCNTKKAAIKLNEELGKRGYNCDELHGDMTQSKREKVMKSFRKLQLQFLVATDLAARGLDVEGITHVFNYDITNDTKLHIHRIGRTGRAGESGVAVTLVTPETEEALRSIEKAIKMTIKNDKSPGTSRPRERRSYNKPKKPGQKNTYGKKKNSNSKYKSKRR
ncbi:MAG: DEAD/DEAH box helicase [Anaeromicrobium sp.]|uniref:DEAD/DEAH box helicase n=1 Tax=Anaeromicrobium sp. TaxID=1929132 RepID=UPI0025CEDD72|nr:DEAD/DEAH box helicase [Anaeromicrobium sp.]MCT4593260.1 DEAD/DEAH box helicase [Anaeromicrobium sp.]